MFFFFFWWQGTLTRLGPWVVNFGYITPPVRIVYRVIHRKLLMKIELIMFESTTYPNPLANCIAHWRLRMYSLSLSLSLYIYIYIYIYILGKNLICESLRFWHLVCIPWKNKLDSLYLALHLTKFLYLCQNINYLSYVNGVNACMFMY